MTAKPGRFADVVPSMRPIIVSVYSEQRTEYLSASVHWCSIPRHGSDEIGKKGSARCREARGFQCAQKKGDERCDQVHFAIDKCEECERGARDASGFAEGDRQSRKGRRHQTERRRASQVAHRKALANYRLILPASTYLRGYGPCVRYHIGMWHRPHAGERGVSMLGALVVALLLGSTFGTLMTTLTPPSSQLADAVKTTVDVEPCEPPGGEYTVDEKGDAKRTGTVVNCTDATLKTTHDMCVWC